MTAYSYTYTVQCPSCSLKYQHTRDEPYVRPRLHKLCNICREKQVEEASFQGVIDCGALQTKAGCFNCKHFTPLSKGWGKCGLGHTYDTANPEEYDKPLDLVYELDTCADWKVGDDQD